MKRVVIVGVLVCLITSLAACAKESHFVDETALEAQQYYVHTVRYSGETLGLIANWYTGEVRNWNLIQEANPGLRPERITIGQQINIPRGIMTNSETLTREVVRGGVRNRSAASSAKSSSSLPAVVEPAEVSDPPPAEDTESGAVAAEPVVEAESKPAAEESAEVALERELVESIEEPIVEELAVEPLEEPKSEPVAELITEPSEVKEAASKSEIIVDRGSAAKAPEPKQEAPSGDDERERLLEELLQQ